MSIKRSIQTSRFSSTDWYDENREITIGGCGTIGSWTSVLLSRSNNHSLILYDPDKVEDVNLAGQFFKKTDIDKYKTQAVYDSILEFNEDYNDVDLQTELLTEDSYVSPVCISGFDNMKARKAMFDAWSKLENREIFIDGRMSVESLEIITVFKGQEEAYRSTLFDDKDVPDPVCSLKSTSHVGAIIGGFITSILNNALAMQKDPDCMRSIPFNVRIDLSPFIIKITEEYEESNNKTSK